VNGGLSEFAAISKGGRKEGNEKKKEKRDVPCRDNARALKAKKEERHSGRLVWRVVAKGEGREGKQKESDLSKLHESSRAPPRTRRGFLC